MQNRYNEILEDIENLKLALDRLAGLTPNNKPIAQHSILIRLRAAAEKIEMAMEVAERN